MGQFVKDVLIQTDAVVFGVLAQFLVEALGDADVQSAAVVANASLKLFQRDSRAVVPVFVR